MKVECVGKGFVYTWPGGEVTLEPGKVIDLPDERAKRLLKKAGNRVRPVLSIQPGDLIAWHSANSLDSFGQVECLHIDGDGNTWAFVTMGEDFAVVNVQCAQRIDEDA